MKKYLNMSKGIVVVLLTVALLAGMRWYMKAGTDGTGPMAMTRDAMPVSVIKIKTESIPLSETLPGRISPYRQAEIRPQVSGIITERLFEEGAYVEKGQQLYQINDAPYRAALSSAKADLNSARANVKSIEARTRRYDELIKIDAVSKQEYDDVKAQLDQALAAVEVAQAAVDVAQVNFDYTKVYAPIAGHIGKSRITEGALVTTNQTQSLAVVTQLDPVYIDMTQSGLEVMRLRSIMRDTGKISVRIVFDKVTGESYPHEGVLQFSDVTVDETTGSVGLRAIMPNPDLILLPGLFVQARVNMGEREVMLVPQRAATRNPDGTLSVWVVNEENKASPRLIETSGSYKDQWVVKNGIAPGDTIVIEGYQKIAPDASVAPTPWAAPGSSIGPAEKTGIAKKAGNTSSEPLG